MTTYSQRVYQTLKDKYPEQEDFLGAVEEFFQAIQPVLEAHPEYEDLAILERMVEPERIFIFRVPWLDDEGKVQVNTGYRVQYSSLNGPYKGGIRFHPTVNLSIMKALAFEQTFKNSLTTLPIGGGKGGADFDPKGKSDQEVMKFTQSFVTELQKYIGQDQDVPAGDIGVGGREIGYMMGQYRRLNDAAGGVFTGKPVLAGGSLGRTQATGHGVVYFLNHVLEAAGDSLAGKRVMISGAGNVAYYAAELVEELGGIVVSLSDSTSAVYQPDGLDLNIVKELKIEGRERISRYLEEDPEAKNFEGSLWDQDIQADIALPCATQGEINGDQAQRLVDNGVRYVVEGANLPCNKEAQAVFKEAGVQRAPAKASNAGGVAVSALEMAQNSMRLAWNADRVEEKLQAIMQSIFDQCLEACKKYDLDQDYVAGADIASFENIAELMKLQGVI
ncbi:NADP-specific glutamate dehydrogenase [Hutsoniella sourekii]|uniref:NADP-specific glutamate dehydrogenase n=1 Tax=Hutsoniella sourekii TaxID=87650 RepID=UPI000485534A|nr:NADP-specific glutamate dehydrogenase [Hutsoniella sourekii]